ncbi:MAG: CHAT domain-containing protein [Cyanobacteria bacterium SBLK]|nr:CHAT domain-containing protein [Cyanobacteria bacterium SBLK]
MNEFTRYPRLFILLFLISSIVTLSLNWLHPIPVSVKSKILSRVAIGALPTVAAEQRPTCAYGDISCWEEVRSQLDLQIAYYKGEENWQAVAQSQRQKAEMHNQLGEFSQAIALLCGAATLENDCQCKPDSKENCKSESAVGYAKRANDDLGELAIWGILAESYRLNSDYDFAVLVTKKFTGDKYLCSTAPRKCSAEIEGTLQAIAGKVYTDRAQRYQQQARSARERGANDAAGEFYQKAEKDRDDALEKLTNSRDIVETDEERARIGLEILRVHENRVRALSEQSLLDLNNKLATNRQKAIAELETLYPQLSSQSLQVRILLSLAKLTEIPDGSATDASNESASFCQLSDKKRSRQLLQQALDIAEKLEDRLLKSFALGELGHLEECANDFDLALDYTQKARSESQFLPAIQYFWHWQAGRIWLKKERRKEALYAYKKAIATLEGLRPGRLIDRIRQYPRDWQFDFRDSVAPLYREYARLLLEKGDSAPSLTKDRSRAFTQAGKVIETLQLLELEEYFGEECNPPEDRASELVDRHTAIFRSIVFKDKTAILLEIRDRPIEIEWVQTARLREKIKDFRRHLIEQSHDIENPHLESGGDLYDLLIQPFVRSLRAVRIDTLVLVQDGILNSIPMAALYDRKTSEFLVENYTIAMTPGLDFTMPRTRRFRNFRILAFGLTESSRIADRVGDSFENSREFEILNNVQDELDAITEAFPGSQQFTQDEFSPKKVELELQSSPYSILHFATHAQFGAVSKDTFLVSGAIYPNNPRNRPINQKLTLLQLEKILRHSKTLPHLLVLSACETAAGDDRFTLGLGGIALRSGVPTTVASLWPVEDRKTKDFIIQFYEQLAGDRQPASALRKAQKQQIDNNVHPAHWAAFISIGNWL